MSGKILDDIKSIKNDYNFKDSFVIESKKIRSNSYNNFDNILEFKLDNNFSVFRKLLFSGVCDYYNSGNLWKVHVLSKLFELDKFRCSSLIGNDATHYGGVSSYNHNDCSDEMKGSDFAIMYFGGNEIISDIIDSYEKSVSEYELKYFKEFKSLSRREDILKYVKKITGSHNSFSYILEEDEFFDIDFCFNSISLEGIEELPYRDKKFILSKFKRAKFISVENQYSQDILKKEGIDSYKSPCPITMLPSIFCNKISSVSNNSKCIQEVKVRFPNGWIALEVDNFSKEIEYKLVETIQKIIEEKELGIVFFKSSYKSISDDTNEIHLNEFVKKFSEWNTMSFYSKDIWDVSSLILLSKMYCGFNLECRILSMAGGVPRINIKNENYKNNQVENYCRLWELDGMHIELSSEMTSDEWFDKINDNLNIDLSLLVDHADDLKYEYKRVMKISSKKMPLNFLLH